MIQDHHLRQLTSRPRDNWRSDGDPTINTRCSWDNFLVLMSCSTPVTAFKLALMNFTNSFSICLTSFTNRWRLRSHPQIRTSSTQQSWRIWPSSTVGWQAFVVTTWSTMVYKCLHDMAPLYLSELCRQTRNIEGRRQLRSATRGDLDVPRCRLSTYGRWAFSCAGPAAWNSLPDRLKNSTLTIEQFRRLLKSFLFF